MRHGNGNVVGNGQYFWLAVLIVAGLAAILIALGAGKPWGKSAVIWTIAAVLALLIVYELAYVLLRRRIAAWTAQGEYPKALALAVRLSKWYYGGRNASAHHAAAANILFQMEEDERFRQETEQITAPRFLFLKYAFRTLGCLVNRDVSAAREALQRFWAERPRGTWKEQGSRLTAFLNVIDPSCPEDRGPLIASLLRTTPQSARTQVPSGRAVPPCSRFVNRDFANACAVTARAFGVQRNSFFS